MTPLGIAKVSYKPIVILTDNFKYKKVIFGHKKLSYKVIVILSGVISYGEHCTKLSMLRIVLPQGLTRTPAPVSAAPRAAAGGGGGGQPGGHGKGERASEGSAPWRAGHKARFKRGRCLHAARSSSLHGEFQLYLG